MTNLENLIISAKYGPHLSSGEAGTIKYLKANHFDEEGMLTQFNGSFLNAEETDTKLLKKGNVIVSAKGFRNFAWAYTSEAGPCIASSLFYVIETNPHKVLSEYLALFLNTPKSQHRLSLSALGVTTPSLPKTELMKLPVFCPPLEEQKKIVRIHQSCVRQIELYEALTLHSRKLLHATMKHLTHSPS